MVNGAALLALARSLQKGVARGVARGTSRCLLARLSDLIAHRVRHHAANNGNAPGDVASVLLAGVGLDAVAGLHAIVYAVADGERAFGQAKGLCGVLLESVIADGQRCAAAGQQRGHGQQGEGGTLGK